MNLFQNLINYDATIIEHDLDLIDNADYIIEIIITLIFF